MLADGQVLHGGAPRQGLQRALVFVRQRHESTAPIESIPDRRGG
jgi:hypothetical protein